MVKIRQKTARYLLDKANFYKGKDNCGKTKTKLTIKFAILYCNIAILHKY